MPVRVLHWFSLIWLLNVSPPLPQPPLGFDQPLEDLERQRVITPQERLGLETGRVGVPTIYAREHQIKQNKVKRLHAGILKKSSAELKIIPLWPSSWISESNSCWILGSSSTIATTSAPVDSCMASSICWHCGLFRLPLRNDRHRSDLPPTWFVDFKDVTILKASDLSSSGRYVVFMGDEHKGDSLLMQLIE